MNDKVIAPPHPDVVLISKLLRNLADEFERGARFDSDALVRMLRQWSELLATATE
jgi:hypothetical protein